MKRNIALSLASRSLSILLIIASFSFLVVGEKTEDASSRPQREIIKSLAQRSHPQPPSPLTEEIDNAITAVVVYLAGDNYSYETTPTMREVLSKLYVSEYQYAYQENKAVPFDLKATLLRDCINLRGQFIVQFGKFADDEFGTPVNVRGPKGYRARERLSEDAAISILATIGGAARLNAESTVSLLDEEQSESKVTEDKLDDTTLSPQRERTALTPSDVVRRYWKVSADGEFNKAWRYMDACGLNSKHPIDREIIKSLTQRIPWIIRNNPKISERKPGELVIGKIEEESLKGDTASIAAIINFRNKPFVRSLFKLAQCKGEWKIENVDIYYKNVSDLRNSEKRKIAVVVPKTDSEIISKCIFRSIVNTKSSSS